MQDHRKKQITKYILQLCAGVLFILYGIWELKSGDEIGAMLGFGAGIMLVVSLGFNYKEDQKRAEFLEEMRKKAPQGSDELLEQVRIMKEKNQDIQAIKLVRERTGMSLYDAKNYVDSVVVKTQ